MIKRRFFLMTVLVLTLACNKQESDFVPNDHEVGTIEHKIKHIPEHNFSTILYEGCEYLIYKEDKDSNSSYGFMAHKGNCSNPIHKCK